MRRLSAKFEPLHERLRQSGFPHPRLYFSNFVRYTPKFDGLVGEVRNREGGARVGIARLADRAGIKEVALAGFDAERSKQFVRPRANLQHFEIVVEVGKSALMVGVSEKGDWRRRVQQSFEGLCRRENVFVFVLKRAVHEDDVV